MKNIVILGSTGSIGVNALDVVRRYKNKFNVVGLAANRNTALLLKQMREFSPQKVYVGNDAAARALRHAVASWKKKPDILSAAGDAEKVASMKSADVVLCGMVGAKGLLPLVAALKAGKTVGLANKEALIVAGDLIMGLSKKHRAPVIPVDSEHSAIFQCLNGQAPRDVARLILTASGGPFYRRSKDLDKITVAQALDHPTWKMGAKITVDSATLMNKGLEAIEAHHLFQIPMERISIVIHPQSIVHSLVEFNDGAMLAQLSHPDMRLPIQYALTHPERIASAIKPLALEEVKELHFAKPNFSRFPALKMALNAGAKGGTAPAALSSSNEVAVQAFIDKKISFMSIPRVVGRVLAKHKVKPATSLAVVLEADRWARHEAEKIISGMSF